MPWVVFTEITWKRKRYGLIHTNSRWMGVSQPNVETMEAWSYTEHDARLASISFLCRRIFDTFDTAPCHIRRCVDAIAPYEGL